MNVNEQILNKIPIGIGVFEIINDVTHQTYMNDSFYKLVNDTEYARTRKKDGDFLKVVKEEDRINVITAIENVKDGSDYEVAVCRAITGDEREQWIRLVASVDIREENYILVYCSYTSMTYEVAAREELMQNNELLRKALEIGEMVVWEYDPYKKILTQTDSCRSLTGYKKKYIYDAPESMIRVGYIYKDFVDDYREFFRRFSEDKCPVEADFRVKNMETMEYWWEHTNMIPIFDTNGVLVKGIGTSVNVSKHKEQESRYLQQINEMEKMNSDNMLAKGRHNISKNRAIYFKANSTGAISVDKAQLYDDSVQKLIESGMTQKDWDTISDHLGRDSILKNYKDGKITDNFIYRRKVNDVDEIWCEIKYVLFEEPATRDIIMFIYSYNVTERIMDNLMMKKISEMEYDVSGIIYVKTGKYSIRNLRKELNNADIKWEGDFEELCSEHVRNVVSEVEKQEIIKMLTLDNLCAALEQGKLHSFNYFMTSADGKLHRKKLVFSYIDDIKSEILFCRSDITDTYKHEQEQIKKTEEALERAQKASEAKTDFLSRMSHDIRTPMNAIIGMTKLAQKEECLDSVREYLDNIESSSDFLLGLINDILDLSKIESGEFELNPEPCRREEFDKDINTIIKPLMEKKHIEFIYEMGCGAECIMADKLRFNQLFFNLLSNAAKYTPEGGEVEFRAQHIPEKNGMYGVRYTIRDNGIGMSHKFLEHLFEPFKQEHSVLSEESRGTGLGLPIVKKIVDAMGGTISVKSELGKGTEYILDMYTPLAASELKKESQLTETDILNNQEILLVEDNSMNIIVASKLLEHVGCRVTVARNGKEALDTYSKSEDSFYKAILMDVRMPVMDGVEATRLIRTLPRKDAEIVPIIAMTADAFAEEQRKTADAGMDRHLTKPINVEELYRTLIELIRERFML